MRRGRKGNSPDQQKQKGERRPSKKVITLFADNAARPDSTAIPAPAWMSEEGKKIFAEKVEKYRQRGQKITGFESALSQYCELEAQLTRMYRSPLGPTMAMVNAHRIWAAEFYDTPASQRVPASGNNNQSANPFVKNGNRPQP